MRSGPEVQELKLTAEAILSASEQDRMRYASLIPEIRKGKKMTQAELANTSGVSRRTIISIESGAAVPQASKLLHILEALQVVSDPCEFGDVRDEVAMIVPLLRGIHPDFRATGVATALTALTAVVSAHPAPLVGALEGAGSAVE